MAVLNYNTVLMIMSERIRLSYSFYSIPVIDLNN